MSLPARLGVGVIGCGAAAQSIHLPVIGSMSDVLRVTHCIDADPAVAASVAARVDARSGSDVGALLEDASVDIVVVCSPDRLHEEHVVAACNAGKRAVLCEKPLAPTVESAERIAQASAQTGVPCLVGVMHRHDPALRMLEERWGSLPAEALVVRSRAWLAPNPALVAMSTDVVAAAPAPFDAGGDDIGRAVFRALMLGLAIHDIPLIRLALPLVDSVEVAEPLGTSGYLVTLRSGDRVAHLAAYFHRFLRTEWSYELWSPNAHARVDFPPSYIAHQPASARLVTRAGDAVREEVFGGVPRSGYDAEWEHLLDCVRDGVSPLTGPEEAVADVALALRIADAAGAALVAAA